MEHINDSLSMLIKLKDTTQSSDSTYSQIYQKVINTLNFLIDQNFENREVTEYNKGTVIKTILTFPQSKIGVVREIMNYLTKTVSISNWIMTYDVEDCISPITNSEKESEFDVIAQKKSVNRQNLLIPVIISLMYCEDALRRVVEMEIGIKELSERTNLIVNTSLDPEIASEIRKKYHVEGFEELTKRLDVDHVESNSEFPPMSPLVPPAPKGWMNQKK